ncbi:MAG TPA: hypothetical protein VE263_20045 [Candidatus Angelobacter sp.]|nr:hypothetical protein [Candidatus Angelobacter sp.]
MTFANPRLRYKVTFQKDEQDRCFYQVEESGAGKLSRRFTAVISATQKLAAKGFKDKAAENLIAKWCELFPGRLPKDGGAVDVNLDEVQKL